MPPWATHISLPCIQSPGQNVHNSSLLAVMHSRSQGFPTARHASLSEWSTVHRHLSSSNNLAHLGGGDVETGEHKGEPGVEKVKDVSRPAGASVKKR